MRGEEKLQPLYLATSLPTLKASCSSAVNADYTENCTTLHFDLANEMPF